MAVFADFCRIVACCLAVGSREGEYESAIKGYTESEKSELAKAMGLLISESDSKPFEDVLGFYYTEIASAATVKGRGEFYTPPAVSEIMAKMSMNPEKVIQDGKPITIQEPCSGAGGMILAVAKQFSPIVQKGEASYVDLLRVTAIDINPIACDMTYINTTLWGIPAVVFQGNALGVEMERGWKNIHWMRVREDERLQTERMVGQMREVMALTENPAKSDSAEAEQPESRVGGIAGIGAIAPKLSPGEQTFMDFG